LDFEPFSHVADSAASSFACAADFFALAASALRAWPWAFLLPRLSPPPPPPFPLAIFTMMLELCEEKRFGDKWAEARVTGTWSGLLELF